MKIFISGGAGFIGTRLIEQLISISKEITIFDKVDSKLFSEFTIIGDIRDYQSIKDTTSGMDCIIHLAAEHKDDINPKSLYYDVNYRGTKNLTEAAESNNVNQIIFVSTVAVYGLNPKSTDESSKVSPSNDYGRSKLLGEEVLIKWADDKPDRKLVIIRPTAVFGEGNKGNIFRLMERIYSQKFYMIGNGKNRKSIAYVGNLVIFIIKTLNLNRGVHIFNYADKPDYPMNEFIKIIYHNMKLSPPIIRFPYFLGFLVAYFLDLISSLTNNKFDVSRARIQKFCTDSIISTRKLESIGFNPIYKLSEALEITIKNEFN
jgi:nucleoside-diphosphate-sugar epimerase